MKATKTERGFHRVEHQKYAETAETMALLIQESSGSSFLWIGQDHHLNREEVRELIDRMEHWLETGRLAFDEEGE